MPSKTGKETETEFTIGAAKIVKIKKSEHLKLGVTPPELPGSEAFEDAQLEKFIDFLGETNQQGVVQTQLGCSDCEASRIFSGKEPIRLGFSWARGTGIGISPVCQVLDTVDLLRIKGLFEVGGTIPCKTNQATIIYRR